MKLDQIISRRKVESGPYDIVFRWEDEISRCLGLSIVDDERTTLPELRLCRRSHLRRVANMTFPWLAGRGTSDAPSLVFEMDAWRDPGYNKGTVIPCIIDFQERSWMHLRCFKLGCNRCPLVLISSLEAFEFLQSRELGLPLRHWALSIPDSLVSDKSFALPRRYDMAVMGRCNPLLESFADRYADSHPDFVFIRKRVRNGQAFYETSRGDFVGHAGTYDEYLSIMRQVRIGLYATPGLDGARVDARGYNQVTPRFLEYLASGCHVIARYPRNADTDYYRLPSVCPSVESYEQFEDETNRLRKIPVDGDDRLRYLADHVTSRRAEQLHELLKELS